MPFNDTKYSANHAFAVSTRERFARTEEGPKKTVARKHLREADRAELCNNEANWILAISRAAEALSDDMMVPHFTVTPTVLFVGQGDQMTG